MNDLTLHYTDGVSLRYGENSHQSAVFYKDPACDEANLASAKQLHGKELSFNNIVDADAALEIVREFAGTPAVAIIKHLNPCGLATGGTLARAFEHAWAGDPVSAFGSVIAVSQTVDLATAQLLKGRFVEILLAPAFEPDALEFLRGKSKDIRILEVGKIERAKPCKVYKPVIGGMLVQDRDTEVWQKFEVPTTAQFPESKEALARFTWIACKHTKSNAIVMGYEYGAGQFMLLGMGPGQPNRIDSTERLCIPRVRENAKTLGLDEATVFSEVVMASDAFFPFPDNVEAAAKAGIRYIVQPGGSLRDQESVDAANQHGIAMAFTGTRHFRH
jgi:phosphoribosylaminoimidazolecarboxamide formyltransferase/IMP cyclohydrolase